jgi:ubiquinone/menaquinone biosynthesis C-methylase UbiE
MEEDLTKAVKDYWELGPCGTSDGIIGEKTKFTKEWFDRIEEYRYSVEPFIHSAAQFTRHAGKNLLEIGVGAGTDHLQWARAGLKCYGVDLTDAAIETTKELFAFRGYTSELQQANAESLPFQNNFFDVIYSWGVIHHSENPQQIIDEIHRVLKPDGEFIGMMYGRHSLFAFKCWVRFALLRGRPWLTFAKVLWHYQESLGTKAYTVKELNKMFKLFSKFEAKPVLTVADTSMWPKFISRFFPASLGYFIVLKAKK